MGLRFMTTQKQQLREGLGWRPTEPKQLSEQSQVVGMLSAQRPQGGETAVLGSGCSGASS